MDGMKPIPALRPDSQRSSETHRGRANRGDANSGAEAVLTYPDFRGDADARTSGLVD